MKRGIVTGLSNGIAFVWTPAAEIELLADEREKPFCDRLKVADWIEFESNGLGVITNYTLVPPGLETKVDGKGRVQVKTEVVFPSKEKGGTGNFITAESIDFGRVGNFHNLPGLIAGKKYEAWVMRVPQSKEHMGREYNVQWCLAKESLEPAKDCSVSSSPAVESSSQKTDSVDEKFLIGLVVSIDQNLAFVWNPKMGEGIVPDADEGRLKIGDWMEFTAAEGKVAQGYKFAVLQYRFIKPLYLAYRDRNTVEVKIPFELTCHSLSEGKPYTVHFFGKIDDDFGLIKKNHAKLLEKQVTAIIRRRKPHVPTGTIWTVVELCSKQPLTTDNDDGVVLKITSPLFSTKALQNLMRSKEVQDAVKDFDLTTFDDILSFYSNK